MKKRRSVNRDPIIAEIREVRDAMARRHDYDAKRIIRAIRAEAAALKERSAPRSTRKASKGRRRAA